jgi:hypothetical protein
LTLQAYQEIGGVKGALAKQAESIYTSLPSQEHRRLARALLLRLIDPGITEQDTTRRRAAFSELSLPDPKQTTILREVADAFIAARLLTANEIAGTSTVEVSHEALIREWTRLSDWLREAREDIHLQQTLSEDVAEWQRRGKPTARLYRGSQLKEAKAWSKRNIPSKHEIAFLHASTAQRIYFGISVIVLVFLMVSSAGIAGWFLLHRPPDPTLVTNLQDDGPGSLRWDIENANSGSTITFDQSLWGHTLTLTRFLLINKKSLSIRGPGAALFIVSGMDTAYGVQVEGGASISIVGLTFKNSPIYNDGTLSLVNNTVLGNTLSSSYGGGISNSGTLTLTNSTVSDFTNNSSYGGGISNSGTLTLTNSTISNNRALSGGGIFNEGTLTLTNSTISNNTASQVSGGGVFNAGTFTLTNSTISHNTAPSSGGGITNDSSVIDDTTKAKTIMTFCTIYGNTSYDSGGGIWDNPDTNQPGQVVIRNSIVAGNTARTGPDITGQLISYGYNLIQDSSGATFAPNQQHLTDISGKRNTDLKIDSVLRANGRFIPAHTFTHALLPGSPALDAIPPDACLVDGITTDQRGVKRPQGSGCDIGAYEYQPSS